LQLWAEPGQKPGEYRQCSGSAQDWGYISSIRISVIDFRGILAFEKIKMEFTEFPHEFELKKILSLLT
jgi:hypothetical protein